MTTQILTEYISLERKPLSPELNENGKNLYLKGIALQGEIENANGRFYPRQEIANAVESLTKRINDIGPVLGEADHPESLLISVQNVSHAIKEIWMEGNDGYVKMAVIDAGMGLIVKGIVEVGGIVGVSTRGAGEVDSKGRVSNFEISTIDVVTTPSAPNAYPKPVFESLLHSKSGRELKYLSEIRNDQAVQKYFKKALNEFLISIRDELTWR